MVDLRHQGGEGVAGTPGACSQVFCHPNSMHQLCDMNRHVTYTRSEPQPPHKPFLSQVAFLRSFRKQLYAVSHGCRQAVPPPPEGATTQIVPSARTSGRRDGPVREEAPHLKGSEKGQGREGAFEMFYTATIRDNPPPAGALLQLFESTRKESHKLIRLHVYVRGCSHRRR